MQSWVVDIRPYNLILYEIFYFFSLLMLGCFEKHVTSLAHIWICLYING
jgi:hypothetical protein